MRWPDSGERAGGPYLQNPPPIASRKSPNRNARFGVFYESARNGRGFLNHGSSRIRQRAYPLYFYSISSVLVKQGGDFTLRDIIYLFSLHMIPPPPYHSPLLLRISHLCGLYPSCIWPKRSAPETLKGKMRQGYKKIF